jgi:hypothetical protein
MKPFQVKCINDCEYLEEGQDGHLHIVPFPTKGKLIALTRGTLYKVLSIENGFYRIVDDTGSDYLFPAHMFEKV